MFCGCSRRWSKSTARSTSAIFYLPKLHPSVSPKPLNRFSCGFRRNHQKHFRFRSPLSNTISGRSTSAISRSTTSTARSSSSRARETRMPVVAAPRDFHPANAGHFHDVIRSAVYVSYAHSWQCGSVGHGSTNLDWSRGLWVTY